MKTIIAGSRSCSDINLVFEAANSCPWLITEVISGCCIGPDRYGEEWALENDVLIKRFPVKWELFGNRAGKFRNIEMANYAEALVAIWDGYSVGTGHMIDVARNRDLPTHVILF